MRALLLGNVNLAPIAGEFRELEVELGGYDDWLPQLLAPGSAAHSAEIEVVVVHLDGDEFFGRGGDVEELIAAAGAFRERNPSKLLVLNSFCTSPEDPATYAAPGEPGSRLSLERAANAKLLAFAKQHPGVLLLDLELLYRRFGADALVSDAFWYLGRVRYTKRMLRELARHLELLLRGALDRGRKLLVLDLDGTLWGGVLGEDGASGIALSEDGKGKVFRDLQKSLKALREAGVLLAIASKNNPDEVEAVFREHPMMVLSLADFAAVRVGWGAKDESLREIAAELSLGLDALVFLDDSPAERELVRRALPEVAVPEPPGRIEALPRWLLREVVYPFFPRWRTTAEDRARPAHYQARRERESAQSSLTHAGFLESLAIRIDFSLDPREHVERASQMTQRTNQFNVTTRRYTVPELRAIIGNSSHRTLLLSYEDRFGKEGIVGLAIVALETAEIDTLLLSCRVIGRGIEVALVAAAEAAARAHGVRRLSARFVPTGRNAPAADVFERCGYALVRSDADGTRHYAKELGA